jgi:hypothetical protein
MSERKSRLDLHVEKTENLVHYLLRKRKESIQNSLIRPLYQEALKSLFLVTVLLLDTLIPLDLFVTLAFPINLVASLAVLLFFLYIETRIYNAVWGKQGCWSLEKNKKTLESGTEEKKT